MTAGAIMAIALIAASVTLLGVAIFRHILRVRRAHEIRDRIWRQFADELSGDAGGHPQPPTAWRGPGARRR